MELCFSHRGEKLEQRYLDTASNESSSRIILTCQLPLSEVVTDFFDQLKGRSSGFASFECVSLLSQPSKLMIMLVATKTLAIKRVN